MVLQQKTLLLPSYPFPTEVGGQRNNWQWSRFSDLQLLLWVSPFVESLTAAGTALRDILCTCCAKVKVPQYLRVHCNSRINRKNIKYASWGQIEILPIQPSQIGHKNIRMLDFWHHCEVTAWAQSFKWFRVNILHHSAMNTKLSDRHRRMDAWNQSLHRQGTENG